MTMTMLLPVMIETSNDSDHYTSEELLDMLDMCKCYDNETDTIDELNLARAPFDARAPRAIREFEVDNCMHVLGETRNEQNANDRGSTDINDNTSTGSTMSTTTKAARAEDVQDDACAVVEAFECTEGNLNESGVTVVLNEDGSQTVHESMNIDKLPMPSVDNYGNVTFGYMHTDTKKPVSPIHKKPKSLKTLKSPSRSLSPKIVTGARKPVASLATEQGLTTQRGHVYTPEQIEWFTNKINQMIGTTFRVPYSFEVEYNNLFDKDNKSYSYRSIRSKLQRMAIVKDD
jgi:hypothetical protein